MSHLLIGIMVLIINRDNGFNFLENTFWSKMANFHFQYALEADIMIFRPSSHRHFCLQFNRKSQNYFWIIFGIIYHWCKNELEKKGKLFKS